MPSSVIHGMLYTPDARTLDIVFRHGKGTYRYFDVSAGEWQAFKRASSKGKYLNAVFKARHPRFEELTVVGPAVVWRADAGSGDLPRDLPDENVWGFTKSLRGDGWKDQRNGREEREGTPRKQSGVGHGVGATSALARLRRACGVRFPCT